MANNDAVRKEIAELFDKKEKLIAQIKELETGYPEQCRAKEAKLDMMIKEVDNRARGASERDRKINEREKEVEQKITEAFKKIDEETRALEARAKEIEAKDEDIKKLKDQLNRLIVKNHETNEVLKADAKNVLAMRKDLVAREKTIEKSEAHISSQLGMIALDNQKRAAVEANLTQRKNIILKEELEIKAMADRTIEKEAQVSEKLKQLNAALEEVKIQKLALDDSYQSIEKENKNILAARGRVMMMENSVARREALVAKQLEEIKQVQVKYAEENK